MVHARRSPRFTQSAPEPENWFWRTFCEIEGCAEVWVHREHMDRGMSIEVEPRPRAAQAPSVIIRDTPLTSGSRKVGQIQFWRAVDKMANIGR